MPQVRNEIDGDCAHQPVEITRTCFDMACLDDSVPYVHEHKEGETNRLLKDGEA